MQSGTNVPLCASFMTFLEHTVTQIRVCAAKNNNTELNLFKKFTAYSLLKATFT